MSEKLSVYSNKPFSFTRKACSFLFFFNPLSAYMLGGEL